MAPISYVNVDSAISKIDWNEKEVEVTLSFTPIQALLGKGIFYLVLLPTHETSRRVYKGALPKKNQSFVLSCSADPDYDIPAVYEGNHSKGIVRFSLSHFPVLFKFYIQLEQSFDVFEESDSIAVQAKEPNLPMKEVLTLVPCYNVKKFCEKVIEESLLYSGQVLAIDDGSTDGTREVLQELAKKHPKQLILLQNTENQGKGKVLLNGFRYALDHLNFDSLVAIDSDAQHKPSDIPRIAEAVLDGEDFVIGSRDFRKMPFKNRFANTCISMMLRQVFPHSPHDTQSGYRAFSKQCLKELINKVDGDRYEMEFDCLLYALSKKKRIRSIPISTIYIDKNASSSFSAIKDSIRIVKVLFKYGNKKAKSK